LASSGDNNKIVYISPVAGGLRVGASYTPSTDNVNTAPLTGGNAAEELEIFEAAVSFETVVGTSSVKADVAFEHRDNDTTAWRGGVNAGFGGVTVGGSVLARNDDRDSRKNRAGSLKGYAYDLGATYAMGAYTFGLTKAFGSQKDLTAAGQTKDDEQSKWSGGLSYALDTGVTLTATYHYAKYTDGAAANASDSNKGHALIGQIKVSF
jgi:outer membrane protein OmpU